MNCDATTKRYTIKVPKDNSFTLILPLKQRTYVSNVPIDTPIVYSDLEDVVLTVGGVQYATTQEIDGVYVQFTEGISEGVFDIILTATYRGAQIRAAYFEALTGVDWQYQSAVQQFIQGSPIMADAAFVIGGPLTDSELEELKAEYRDKIAAAEAAEEAAQEAKEAYDEKAEMLDDVAKQSTLTQGVAAIREDISHIDIDTTTLAKEATLGSSPEPAVSPTIFGWLKSIRDFLVGIVTTNPYAKEAQVKDGNDTAISVAKEIRSEVGTGSDTAAESGTLFAVVKWVKDKVKSIFNLIGTPASGQPSTLFAAIAAGGGGDAQESTSQEILAKLQSIIDAHIITTNLDGFITSSEVSSLGQIIANPSLVVEIYNSSITSLVSTGINIFTNATKVTLTELLTATPHSSFRSMTNMKELDLPKLTQYGQAFGEANANLIKANMPNVSTPSTSPFYNCVNLIDIVIGAKITTSFSLGNWNPTNALSSSSSSLVEPGETFANNLEKLLYNIREHIAGNLPDLTGLSSLTITFSSAVKSAIQADTATSNAFTNKNWTIA